jgi:hypothetical protein
MNLIHGTPPDLKPLRLVSMAPTSVAEDSLISMEAVETIADLFIERAGNVCLTFTPESLRVLECWIGFEDLFRYQPTILTGVPGVEANADFDKYTYNLGKVAYHSVTADLAEEVRRAESMTEEERDASIYKREQSQITRKSGNVKEFKAFDAPDVLGDPVEEDASAEPSNE